MKLYQKSELKDSRIFFDKKPPMFLSIFIVFTLFIVTITFYISSILPKIYIVKAQGTITTSDNTYVGALSDGVLIELLCVEGSYVKKGDVLFTISSGSEGTQYQALLSQLENEQAKIEVINKYINGLNSNYNSMSNEGIEQEYYAKIEYYLSVLKSENKDATSQQETVERKKSKKQTLENEIVTLESQITQLNTEILELKNQIAELEEEDIDLTNQLTQKETDVETKKSEIESKKSEIETLEEEIEQYGSSSSSQAYQTKLQLISEAGTSKTTIETSIVEIESQMAVYQSQDNLYEVKANNEGYVHYLSPLKQGMTIQKTQTIAEISKNEDTSMLVEAYINASDISKIEIGDSVKIAVSGVNTQKYGTLSGSLVSIDVGTIIQETNNGNVVLYRCLVSMEESELKSSDGEVIKAIKSMPVEARIVYDKETYLDWVLEMLNFKN